MNSKDFPTSETLQAQLADSGLKQPKVFLPFVLILALLVVLISFYLPEGVDWRTAFKPASRALISGESPYSVQGFFNPPWTVIPLIPFSVLPPEIGWALYTLTGLILLAILALWAGANRLTFILFLTSPPVLHGILNGNLDWLALTGLLLPHWLGLFFLVIKPQVGLAVVLLWIIEAFQSDGFPGLVKLLTPLGVATLLSFALFGFWPARGLVEIDLWWNASLWPWSIPVGLVLGYLAIRRKNEKLALVASPMLSPYVLLHSWVSALFATLRKPRINALVIGSLWLLVIIRALSI